MTYIPSSAGPARPPLNNHPSVASPGAVPAVRPETHAGDETQASSPAQLIVQADDIMNGHAWRGTYHLAKLLANAGLLTTPLTTAERAVLDACRAETDAEIRLHCQGNVLTRRTGDHRLKDHAQAVRALNTARDVRRAAVKALEQAELDHHKDE